MQYGKAMEKQAYQLLEAISPSLGLPSQRSNGFFKDQTHLIRLSLVPYWRWPSELASIRILGHSPLSSKMMLEA